MHRLLKRQIKKTLGKECDINALDPNILKLFENISEVYDDFEEQRRMSEHIITVSSDELRKSNAQLTELLDERSLLLKNKTLENKEIINLLHQYKDAIDKSLIVSRTDKNGIITYANDKFCQISGYKREELIGNSHNIIKDDSNPPEIYKDLWSTITQKKIWTGTLSNKRKDGEIYYVNSTILPILDPDGNIKEYMGLRDDITKQIKYQETLMLQSERIHTIFNSQENITLIIEPEQRIIVDANTKFLETFGFNSLEEYRNKVNFLSELFNEKESLCAENNFGLLWYEQFLADPNGFHRVSKEDQYGNEQVFRVSCKKIELEQKPHILANMVDITELEHARQKAESAQKAKSLFLANMSHEVRTPLNAIIGFSDILTLAKLEPEQKEYASIISKSALSLLDIVDDVLDISKIESGKLEINKDVFPINTFMDHIVELFSIKAKEKKIRFIYDSDPNIPYSVYTDSTRLRQVLSNLLSNAIKFTPENGHVLYSMNLVDIVGNSAKIEFKVQDSGIGISKEQQDIIFNPFAQADSGISRNYGGTGLGLAICKDIISLLGSHIKVESTLGQGSAFSFVLEVNIDEKENENLHHYEHLNFALSGIKDDKEHLKMNVINYLDKIGQTFEFNQASHEHFDYLFCFESDNLLDELQKFKVTNQDAKVIFVGDKENLSNNEIISYIDRYLDLPIYGSKVFNIISDNSHFKEDIALITKKEQTQVPSTQKHLLVAEDNPNNQKLIEILIKKLEMNCTIVENGQEAIDAYKDNKYDLILMDINMPVLDGVSATKEILRLQEEENGYAIPIIALTANTIEGDKEKYLYAGMDDYLAKPIIFDKFKQMIESYTSSSNHQEELVIDPIGVEYCVDDTIKQLGLDKETTKMLLDNFFLTINDDINLLNEKIKSNDSKEIIDQAHFIKGSCLNLALNEPAKILAIIEEKAKDGLDIIEDFNGLKFSLEQHKNFLSKDI